MSRARGAGRETGDGRFIPGGPEGRASGGRGPRGDPADRGAETWKPSPEVRAWGSAVPECPSDVASEPSDPRAGLPQPPGALVPRGSCFISKKEGNALAPQLQVPASNLVQALRAREVSDLNNLHRNVKLGFRKHLLSGQQSETTKF